VEHAALANLAAVDVGEGHRDLLLRNLHAAGRRYRKRRLDGDDQVLGTVLVERGQELDGERRLVHAMQQPPLPDLL
jgi:hypothetical protein